MLSGLLLRRMAVGAALFGLYGLFVACVRLPSDLNAGTLFVSWLWALAIFPAAGMVIIGGITASAALLTRPVPAGYRSVPAALLETACLQVLIVWLILNEIVFATTSEVIGYETLCMIWYNMHATFQNAWQMGAKYLVTLGVVGLISATVIYRLSSASFRQLWGHKGNGTVPSPRDVDAPLSFAVGSRIGVTTHDAGARISSRTSSRGNPFPQRHPRRLQLAGSMGWPLVVACLLTWQFHSTHTEALAVLFRSAPPLRALNLTRALVGDLGGGPVVELTRRPLISDETYAAQMGKPREPAPNIVLIILESVPATALHCYGYPRSDVSPNMDALAAEGVRFEHCWSTASFSSYGLVSILTSLHLLRAENNDHFADTSFPFLSLPRTLKLAGYQTAIFSSGNEAFDNIKCFSNPRDYDRYYTQDTSGIEHPDCMRMDDQFAIEEFEKWLTEKPSGRAFYCSFYLQSTHFNYLVPEPWASHYQPVPPPYSNGDGVIHIPPDVLPKLRNQYDNAMRYADYWVGRIRSDLQKAGVWDNTVVVIIGDHGEGFMEHGLARHGTHLWEELIRIPLIFYLGKDVRAAISHDVAAGVRTLSRTSADSAGVRIPSRTPSVVRSVVPDTVSGLDVLPTIAALVGIEPHPSWQGRNTLDPQYTSVDRPIFSLLQLTRWQEGVCLNKLKYIYDLTEARSYLFDLSTDPGEKNDLAKSAPDLAAALHELLGQCHTRQLTYYDPSNRPFTHYLEPYQPSAALLARIHAACKAENVHAR